MSMERDEERLAFLRECLSKSDTLTEQVLSTLQEFENRLETMEDMMAPVHESTAKLKRSHENILSTTATVDKFLSKFNITDEIRQRLSESPTAGTGLSSFFEALDKVNDAFAFMVNNRSFKSAEKCLPTLKALSNSGLHSLEALFGRMLDQHSTPISRDSLSRETTDPQPLLTIPQNALSQLSQMRGYLFSFGRLEYQKKYRETRQRNMAKTMTVMTPDKVKSDADLEPKAHVKGSNHFTWLLNAFAIMIKAELTLARTVLNREELGLYGDIVEPSLDLLIETVSYVVKKNKMSEHVFVMLDFLTSCYNLESAFRELLQDTPKNAAKMLELVRLIEATATRAMEELEQDVLNPPGKAYAPSPNGGIFPLTMNILNTLHRLFTYQATVERILKPSAPWGTSPITNSIFMTPAPTPSPGPSPSSAFAFQAPATAAAAAAAAAAAPPRRPASQELHNYICRIVQALESTLEAKSRTYKSPSLTSLFLMNNYHFVLKMVLEKPELTEVLGQEFVTRYEGIIGDNKREYQTRTWDRIVQSIAAHVQLEYKKGSEQLTSAGCQLLKQKYSGFNEAFAEIVHTQSGYTIPDATLRSSVRHEAVELVKAMYQQFLQRYPTEIFTKNPDKYLKYTVETVEQMINSLFESTPI
eukprot:GAFH01001096.1.p1 GENE.GAFH01001096.1~~GAFH01001096.1.p1  ORF type:complete len:643 (-),score=192.19 GAFH01001096.1:31-1959(-)